RDHHLTSKTTHTSVRLYFFAQPGIRVRVSNVERLAGANSLAVRALGELNRPWKERPQGGIASGIGARERRELDLIACNPGQYARVRPEQTDGAGHDRVEHRLDVCLRLADNSQDVAGGRLLVQSRGQVTVARLQLSKQPHVLDCD